MGEAQVPGPGSGRGLNTPLGEFQAFGPWVCLLLCLPAACWPVCMHAYGPMCTCVLGLVQGTHCVLCQGWDVGISGPQACVLFHQGWSVGGSLCPLGHGSACTRASVSTLVFICVLLWPCLLPSVCSSLCLGVPH